MTLLARNEREDSNAPMHLSVSGREHQQLEALTVNVKSTVTHESPMPDHIKEVKRKDAPCLKQLFEEVLKDKGEFFNEDIHLKNRDTVEMSELSNVALHCFVLKAQELGKKITYEKTLTVKITD